VTVTPNVLFQDLGGESVLLNLANDQYYGLDEVGTRIWQLLAVDGDVAGAVTRLHTEYEGQVDGTTLRRDVDDLIDRLVSAGLLTIPPPAA
jgi:hypothetical protein